jgi:archaellum component FlaC
MSVDTIVAAAISLTGSLITVAVLWGNMQSKLEALKDRADKFDEVVDEIPSTYVTLEHFKDTIRPIRDQMAEMRNDIKSILFIVSQNEPNRKTRKPTN